jgi:hypothetical protein
MQIPALVAATIFAAVEAPWLFLVVLFAWVTWQAIREPAAATD